MVRCSVVAESVEDLSLVGGWLSVVGGSVQDLSVGRWSVVGGRWVGRGLVGGSVVGCWWSVACRWSVVL